MIQASDNSSYDLPWCKRMALQLVGSALPPDVDPNIQIEILKLSIQLVEGFLLDESVGRPALTVVPIGRS